jgi:hypothetical protein
MKTEVKVTGKNIWKDDDMFVLIPTVLFRKTGRIAEVTFVLFIWLLEIEINRL